TCLHQNGCCASLIMSPFVLDRNVPLIRPPKGGQIGADRDESGGIAESRSAGAGAQRAAVRDRCEPTAAGELSAGPTVVEALPRGRSCGSETPQGGAHFQPRLWAGISAPGVALGAREVWRGGRGTFRPHAGRRAFSIGRSAARALGNFAALDAGRGTLEPRA